VIDFRYHLVSLVSVFLALAVGIVLGAGPLKEPIGESLQSQVDALRSDRDNLRSDLDAAKGNIDKQNEFVTAAAPELIGGTLDGQEVSIIAAPEADSEQVEEVSNRVKEADGTIAGDVSFVPNTLSLADSAQFLKKLRTLVPNLPKDDSTAIRAALVIALTGNASMLEDARGSKPMRRSRRRSSTTPSSKPTACAPTPTTRRPRCSSSSTMRTRPSQRILNPARRPATTRAPAPS
jgi:hypothetical protein